MKQLLKGFIEQLRHAIAIGEKAAVTLSSSNFNNVVIAGMGGSGLGGNLVQSFVTDKLSVPVVVNKSYTVPKFVGSGTLFIGSSFSGSTEETLAAAVAAFKNGATVCLITTGGEMLRLAQENELPHITIPGDLKQPRACLGYSFVQMLYLLFYAKLLGEDFKIELEQTIALLEEHSGSIKVEASALANALKDRMSVVYSSDAFEPVALRLQQQLNENSKQLCHVNVFPEMNHNEIVGWDYPKKLFEQLVVLLVRSGYDHPRVEIRMELCKNIFERKVQNVLEVNAQGATMLEQAFYLIHMFDWVSVYLAELNNVDPNTIDNINYLKGELSKE